MNVTAEEVLRLTFLNEIAHRGGAGVQARADAVEFGAVWRSVANQHQGPQIGKPLQPFGELWLAVFPGRIKRRRIGGSQSRHLPSPHLKMALVQGMHALAR